MLASPFSWTSSLTRHTWPSPWHFWLLSWLVLEWVVPVSRGEAVGFTLALELGLEAQLHRLPVLWDGQVSASLYPSSGKWDKPFRVVVRIEMNVCEVPGTSWRQSVLKEINPLGNFLKEINQSSECSLGGLVLKLKLQHFGHLMQRTDSLGKTLMLGKFEGGRRRG